MRLSLLPLGFAVIAGCAVQNAPAASVSAVVHDADDRVDVYAAADAALGAQAAQSVVALVQHNRLAWNGGSYDVVGVTDLAERQNLCPTERFADQPTVATCSGTLIDDDLVLTAGHCILPQGAYGTAGCTTLRFVFDFLETAPGTLAPIGADDVYGCRAVLAHHLDDEVDYAIVQLDRTVVGRTPAVVRRVGGGLPIGDRLTEIGFPTGMPMKIDAGGRVLDPGPSSLAYFVSDLDGFRGNSGSGVLDEARRVVGIVARTSESDYVYDSARRCYVTAVASGQRGSLASTYVDWAIDELCGTRGYPSQRLCGIAPSCGDAACTAGESASCAADCPTPICGDGVCEPTDTTTSCPYDCGATVITAPVGGCSLQPARPSMRGGLPWGLVTAIVLVLRARSRRRAPLLGARSRRRGTVLAIVGLTACAFAPGVAAAQPRIHPWGLRFVATVDGHADRATLWNQTAAFGTLRASGRGGGLRIGADMGLGRWAGLELTAGVQGVGGLGMVSVELLLAPRFRVLMRPRHELYLRAPIGASAQVDPYGDVTRGLLTGGGVGYRWQLTRVVDAFVELEAVGRFGGRVDPYFAYAEGYGLHPSSPPNLRSSSLGVRLGIGLGRGVRPVCAAP